MTLPILVVGGGLAGMAAAVRLAKRGHPVQLLEQNDRLGGAWAPRQIEGASVDAAPSVITFPAPWRDLFRKSGRSLEAELGRCGHALVPAPPARYLFPDATTLALPTDRGEEFAVLSARYGTAVAKRWRSLIDPLDRTWQDLRRFGLEAELPDRTCAVRAARLLRPAGQLAEFAAQAPHPHLTALLRSVAYRLGSRPEETPAWCAVDVTISRTFGRWMVDSGETSALVQALIARLQLRGVVIRLHTRATHIRLAPRAEGVVTSAGEQIAASAVIWAADPWQAMSALSPGVLPRLRRDVRRLRPALAPTIRHDGQPTGSAVEEVVELDRDGVPVVHYLRPGVRSTHDFRQPRPDPNWGPRWRRRTDLARRPPITSPVSGLFLASASSPAGNGPSQVVLTGALASTACANYAERSVFPG